MSLCDVIMAHSHYHSRGFMGFFPVLQETKIKPILKHFHVFIIYQWLLEHQQVPLCSSVCREARPNADLVVASMLIEKGNDGSNVVFLDDV